MEEQDLVNITVAKVSKSKLDAGDEEDTHLTKEQPGVRPGFTTGRTGIGRTTSVNVNGIADCGG